MPPENESVQQAASQSVEQSDKPSWLDLSSYSNQGYAPGRGKIIRAAWHVVSLLIFESGWFPFRRPKVWLLRLFGARVGCGLVIKPQVRIKFPWRLTVGNHCWIGQSVWIDNLAEVCLGDHICVSQGAYLCTGSHNYRLRSFNLVTRPMMIENGAWIGAKAVLLPGCHVGANTIVGAGSVVRQPVGPEEIVAGNPAESVCYRCEPRTSK